MLYKNLSVFFCLLLATGLLMADDSERHVQVDGMSVYLGVIPAQLTSQKMHDRASSKEHNYHVLIALFDSKSGERISDARLKATVAPLGLGGHTKGLEMMHEDALSYGNYFVMHKPGRYRILVEIQRGENQTKSIANFVYQRPKD